MRDCERANDPFQLEFFFLSFPFPFLFLLKIEEEGEMRKNGNEIGGRIKTHDDSRDRFIICQLLAAGMKLVNSFGKLYINYNYNYSYSTAADG